MKCYSCHREIPKGCNVIRYYQGYKFNLCSNPECLSKNLDSLLNEIKTENSLTVALDKINICGVE